MDEKPIKKLLGSLRYGVRLEIIETFEKLEEIFARIELFEGENKIKEFIVDSFEDLIINITEFWEEEAQLSIYPRKTATWLSDYLYDLGYPDFDFTYVYRTIIGKVREGEELERLTKLLELTDPDVKPKIRSVELELPETDQTAFLAEELDNFIDEAPQNTKGSVVYFDKEGNISASKTTQDITPKSEAEQTELFTITSFENESGSSLNDVQINNVIPYHYKVTDINTIGFEGVEPTKKLLDDGIQLTWVIPELKANQVAKIELNLERRIARTIAMNIDQDVNIINTYFNIKPLKDRYSATNSFTNVQPDIIDNLVIEDEIPTTFNLLEVKPTDDQYTMNMEKTGFEQLLKWQYDEIATEKEIRHLYYLVDRKYFIFTQLTVKSKQDDEPIIEIKRLIEPNIRYYELLVSYYIKLHRPIAEFYIREQISEGVNVNFLFPKTTEKTIEIIADKLTQVWKIIPALPSMHFEFGYIVSGEHLKTEFPIELQIPNYPHSTSTPVIAEFEDTPVFLPEMHQLLHNNRSTSEIPEQ